MLLHLVNSYKFTQTHINSQVTSTSDAKQQETDRNMNQMHKILKSVKRVSMARLMNNPRSFAQTVENLFTMSFLVRDGRAQLLHGKDGSIDVGKHSHQKNYQETHPERRPENHPEKRPFHSVCGALYGCFYSFYFLLYGCLSNSRMVR